MPRRSPPRFLVDQVDLRARRVRLTGDELHHLRVRRLRRGSRVALVDSNGVEYAGVVTRIDPGAAEIEVGAAATAAAESPLRLTLAQAALKGAHLDLVIEKTTELGVAELVIFTGERSVARPGRDRLDRWKRIAAGATKQCGRASVPEITGPLSFEEMLRHLGSEDGKMIAFDPGSTRRLTEVADHLDRLAVIVGPEGGLSEAEIEGARRAGAEIVGLGPRILRGETAAVAATALCQLLWGDLGTRLA